MHELQIGGTRVEIDVLRLRPIGAGVALPKFATPCSTIDANFGIGRTLAESTVLVP
jgi:hypothetical protein